MTETYSKAGRWVSISGFLLTLIAWIEIVFNEYASINLGVAALIVSIVACCLTRRSIWRDLSIISIIASAVLTIIYAIFFLGINFAIKSL